MRNIKQAHDELRKSSELDRRPSENQQESTVALHPFLRLQRMAGNRAVTSLLASHGQLRLQRKCADCSPTSKCPACEEEDQRIQRKPKTAVPHIQRAPRNGNSAGEPVAGGLIVEDDAASVSPGQMRKTEFLEQLRSAVCATADEALKEAGQSTEGCPYIEQWLGYYADQEPAHIERALRKFAPEAASATSARDYIPAVSNRVRRAVDTWARTGEMPDVPEELAGMLGGPSAALGAMAGMLGGALAGIGSAIAGAVSAAAGAIGSAFSSIGKALFKRREGRTEASDDPQSIQAQLSEGHPLDGTVGSRMGAAFGHDFSSVRVHTGAQAAGLSDQLNARAFTIGSDIAFGAGEYQPGTLIGDALIAHELAHVVQQSGDSSHEALHKGNEFSDTALEEEADAAAVGAISTLWLGAQGALAGIGRRALPRVRSGLQLQRCSKSKPELTKAEDKDPKKALPARRKVAEAITIIDGTADEKDKAVVVDELVKIPLEGLVALKNKDVKVVVCRNSVTEIRTDLKGVRPRYYPEGKTWDTVPGLNDPNNDRVIIATRNGRVPPKGDGHDAHNLVLHEVGHAIGHAIEAGGLTDPKFIEAREKDKARLSAYFTQEGEAGTQETYAESFARFYGNDPDDAKKYPNLHAYWASDPLIAVPE